MITKDEKKTQRPKYQGCILQSTHTSQVKTLVSVWTRLNCFLIDEFVVCVRFKVKGSSRKEKRELGLLNHLININYYLI